MKTLIEEYGVFIISLFTVIIVLLMSTTFTRKAETSSKYALGDFEAQYEQKIGEEGNTGGNGSGGSGSGGGSSSGENGGNTGGSGGDGNNTEDPDDGDEDNPNTSTITHIHDYSITTSLQEPTCTEKGYEIQKCSKCSKQQTVEIKALEHNMTDKVTKQPTCTATGTRLHTCLRCGYNYNTVEAILPHPYSTSWTIDIPEKCLTEGSKSKHCTVCDAKGYITRIPALGHKYTTKTYTWASNGSSCSAKTICEHDSSHVVTEQATVITTVKTQPTCVTKGTHRYTANFSNSLFTQQVKDLEDINQSGHLWGTPTYTWSSTGSSCTAKRVCSRSSSHVEQQNASISSTVTVAATCTTAGKHKYTATFTNSAFTTQTKEIQDIALTGHTSVVTGYSCSGCDQDFTYNAYGNHTNVEYHYNCPTTVQSLIDYECATCNGSGIILYPGMSYYVDCPQCSAGIIYEPITVTCPRCEGTGYYCTWDTCYGYMITHHKCSVCGIQID